MLKIIAPNWALKLRIRRTEDRGAIAVETAIVSIALAIILFGIVEFGMLISQTIAISTTTRSGARTGASAGASDDADYQVLQAVKNSRGFIPLSDISRVVIYQASRADGDTTAACKAGVAVANVCNVYTTADLDMTADQLAASGHSTRWDSSDREAWTDHIGVYMQVKHHWITGFFTSGTSTMDDTTVMQIQPAANLPWIPPVADPEVAPTSTTIKHPTTTHPHSSKTTTTRRPTTTTRPPTGGGGPVVTTTPPPVPVSTPPTPTTATPPTTEPSVPTTEPGHWFQF